MENRKLATDPVREEGPSQAKGHDFEPLINTDKPKVDDPPSPPPAYDCKPPRPEIPNGQGKTRG